MELERICETCRHYLGGGCCRINLEAECREGGGFEAWEQDRSIILEIMDEIKEWRMPE